MSIMEYTGRCFCGAVEVRVVGEPVSMGYCHCASCRSWSASPVNAFTLWRSTSVNITAGLELLGSFRKTRASDRHWCQRCGGHVLTEHPILGVVDVYAATIPQLPFRPSLHVHYGATVMPSHDALPKLRDLPSELGGSGIVVTQSR